MSKSEEWSARLSRYVGGESVVAFCLREGVSTASFYAWRRRLGPRFVEVGVSTEPSMAPPLVVEVGAARVEVPAGFDPAFGDVEGLFVFVNRRRDRLKVLWRDKTGWCLLYKRLDAGRRVRLPSGEEERVCIDASTLAFVLDDVSKGAHEERDPTRGRREGAITSF